MSSSSNALEKCPVCKNDYTETNMAECTRCKKWIHYDCANIGDEVENNPEWECPICAMNATQKQIVVQHAEIPPRATSSVSSGKSTGRAERIRIQMKILDAEEEILRKQQQLIAQRKALINEMSDEELEIHSTHGVAAQQDKAHQKTKQTLVDPPCGKSIKPNDAVKQYLQNLPKQTNKHLGETNPITKYESQAIADKFELSSQQLATRHVLSKDLPNFSGNPGEWPVFISSFYQTTTACGYSKSENLIRLQRCLKGKAREVVEAQLTLPSCVPQIMETLRLFYGRPELIMEHYITKIRKMTSPKMERMESVVEYAVAVRNLCATFEQSELQNHMRNPMLMKELVDKLPPVLKLNWAAHKRTEVDAESICVFGDFLNDIITDICSIMPSTSWFRSNETKTREKKEVVNVHDGLQKKSDQAVYHQKKCQVCQEDCKSVSACNRFGEMSVSERWNFVKKLNLCKQCLKRHFHKCHSPVPCSEEGCDKKHHPLLHNICKDDTNSISDETIMSHYSITSVRFRILPVLLSHNGKSVKTYAFLDEGSSSTLLNEDIANQLELQGESEPLCLKWSGSISRQEKESKRVQANISGVYQNAPEFRIANIRTVENLNLPIQTLDYLYLAKRYPHLKNLPVQSYFNARAGILIGLRNWHVAVPLKIIEAAEDAPIAAKCRLGWTIFSTVEAKETIGSQFVENLHFCDCQLEADAETHRMIKEFFSVDSLGIAAPKDSRQIQEEDRARCILSETTKHLENRYETGLLWRYEKFKLPDSRPMAVRRMMCLENRLKSDKDLKENIKKQIRDYEQKGYIRKLNSKELAEPQERIWYLPIFPVHNPNKPNKVRIVWDAAATVDGISLNTLLMKGIDWNSSLLGVLIRSRERKICISADIKEMYHQVKIPEKDQHVLRFLWRNDESLEPTTYVMQVMTFGATCSPSCAQFVKNHNAVKFTDDYPKAVRSIIKSHYVDDMLESVDTEAEAIKLANEVTLIHANAGFEIRNWKSNSSNVMSALNPESSDDSVNLSLNPEHSTEKILGMWWCLKSDEYTFSLCYNKGSKKVLSGESRPTKRDVLRVLMSIYDPIGLIANFLVFLKILLQDIWRSRIEWDDTIKDDQFKAWNKWLKVLPKVEKIRIPRCILKQLPDWTGTMVQLHVFVDAGEQACATVAYLRLSHGDKVDCSLIGAKTKVAPIKLRSIPRLELDAAVMGCRFAKQISEEFSINITKLFFWSDSKTVLGWIKNDPHRYNKFVAFRVAEIQDSNCSGVWRYISSKENVADEATKWVQPPKLDIKDRWFQGPSFLLLDQENWPKDITTESVTTEELLFEHLVAKPLVDLTRFSKWTKLLNTIAYVIRFLNIKVKMKPQLPTKGILSGDELKLAETVLLRIAQRDVYYKEYSHLMKQYEQKADSLQPTVHRSSSIKCLSPYLDEQQLLRVRGRLDAATFIDINMKRPLILPRKHPITHLIVQKYHEQFLHANQESVVNQLRQTYLIPKLRPVVKYVCQRCQWCKIRKANPRPPEMSPLPLARLSPYCEPFTFTGVDYFGPLTVMVGRRQEKRWGVIFTCLTIRAVHIEIAYKLDADSFILCFQDFIQRRGQPKEIYCDRGTNFIGAERLLRQELEAVDPLLIANKFVSPSLKWRFNPPVSPHMGGAWERLVRSFKIAMYSSLPTRTPTDPLLRSCLVAAENIINSRPLTYVPIKDDLAEALTPNHFLRLNSGGEKAIGQLNDNQKVLKFTYQYKERFANRCWERFIHEYTPELTLRSKWYDPVPPLKVGDIVLIVDKDLPRNTYPKGRIIAVKTSSDGQVRSAVVQTSSGILQRPSVKLALLEVTCESNGTTTSNPGIVVPGGTVKNKEEDNNPA